MSWVDLLIVGICAGYVVAFIAGWALCTAAKRGDQLASEFVAGHPCPGGERPCGSVRVSRIGYCLACGQYRPEYDQDRQRARARL